MSLLYILLLFADWTQFAGPTRDFRVDSKGLASTWPAAGPKKLWSRPLGEGYAGIATSGATLYTMYRRGGQEVVLAADTATGATRWEHAYDAPTDPSQNLAYGPGPHSTPAIAGDRIFTIGITLHLHALDSKTGKVVWVKNLRKDFPGSTEMDRGYSSSPLVYKDLLILQLGGSNQSVIALRQKDGSLAWRGGSFTNSPSSPSVFNIAGQDQVITPMSDRIVGLDAASGAVLWSHSHQTDYGLNIALPVAGPDGIIVISSAYSGGARALQLTRDSAGKTGVKELWAHKQLRVHHSSMIRIGDVVYGSSGDFGPAPMTAVDVKTGRVLWRDRAFSKSNFVLADGKLVLLDEDGALALATVSPEGMKVLAKTPVLTHTAWTTPTVAGTVAYVRDRKTMAAVDLK